MGNLPLGVVIICTFGFGALFSVWRSFVLKRSSAVVLGVAAKSGPPRGEQKNRVPETGIGTV